MDDRDGGGCVSKRAASRGRPVQGRANSVNDDKDGGGCVSKQVASLGRPARGSRFVELLPVVVQYEGVQVDCKFPTSQHRTISVTSNCVCYLEVPMSDKDAIVCCR